MNRHEAISKAAQAFAKVVQENTREGRTQDVALAFIAKAVQRANRVAIVDSLKTPKETP